MEYQGGIGLIVGLPYTSMVALNWIVVPPPPKLWFFRDRHPEADFYTSNYGMEPFDTIDEVS